MSVNPRSSVEIGPVTELTVVMLCLVRDQMVDSDHHLRLIVQDFRPQLGP